MQDERKIDGKSLLRQKIDEISKIDPTLEYTLEEIQKRREARLKKGSGLSLLQLNQRAKGPEVGTILFKRPGAAQNRAQNRTFWLNTDYYLNSMLLVNRSKNEQKAPLHDENKEKNGEVMGIEEPVKNSSKENEVIDPSNEVKLPVQSQLIKLHPIQQQASPLEKCPTFGQSKAELPSTQPLEKEKETQKKIFTQANLFGTQMTQIPKQVQTKKEGTSFNLFGQESTSKSMFSFIKKEKKKDEGSVNPFVHGISQPLFGSSERKEAGLSGGLFSQSSSASPVLFASQSNEEKKSQSLFSQANLSVPLIPPKSSTEKQDTNFSEVLGKIGSSGGSLFQKAGEGALPGLFTKSSQLPVKKEETSQTPGESLSKNQQLTKKSEQKTETASQGLFGKVNNNAGSGSFFGSAPKKEKSVDNQAKTQENSNAQVKFGGSLFGAKSILNATSSLFPQKAPQEEKKSLPFSSLFGSSFPPLPKVEEKIVEAVKKPEPVIQQINKPSIFSSSIMSQKEPQKLQSKQQQKYDLKKEEKICQDEELSKNQSREPEVQSPIDVIMNDEKKSPEFAAIPSPTKEKPGLAIGPGGKKIELPDSGSFFLGEKKGNIFSGGNSSLFGQSSQGNIFGAQSKPSLFAGNTAAAPAQVTEKKEGLFGGKPSGEGSLFGQTYFNKAATGGNIFGQSGGSLFGAGSTFFQGGSSQNIFENKNSLFPVASTTPKQDQQEQGEEDDDEPLQAEQQIDPSKSTGKYDYVQSNVLFKQTAVKFRHGTKETLQNVTVSLQKFGDGKSTFIFVRLANKCIAFSGTLMPGTTEVRILNSSSKNLEIKKIVCADKKPPELALVKIQLKDEAIGGRLQEQIERVLGQK